MAGRFGENRKRAPTDGEGDDSEHGDGEEDMMGRQNLPYGESMEEEFSTDEEPEPLTDISEGEEQSENDDENENDSPPPPLSDDQDDQDSGGRGRGGILGRIETVDERLAAETAAFFHLPTSSSQHLPDTNDLPSSTPNQHHHPRPNNPANRDITASGEEGGSPLMPFSLQRAGRGSFVRTSAPTASEISNPGEQDYYEEEGGYDWEGIDVALGIDRRIGRGGEGIGLNSAIPSNPTSAALAPSAIHGRTIDPSSHALHLYPQQHNQQHPMMEDAPLTELETAGYTLEEILSHDKYRRRVARDYQRFLTTFTDEQGYSVYQARIRAMCAANSESLQVSYLHLVETNAFLAKLVANVPSETLAIFNEATMRIVLRLFEEYDRIKSEIHVRIADFPALDHIRDLRHNQLGTLVRVTGVVTRRSGVFPQLTLVKYDCGRCGAVLGPFVQDLNREIRLNACSECEARGPFSINTSQTVYRNYQRLTLQESPGSVPAGRLPRHKEVILLWDLIDLARPGELIEVTGIYRNNFSYSLNTKHSFPVFATSIEANHLARSGSGALEERRIAISMEEEGEQQQQQQQLAALRLTEEDQAEIRQLARDPHLALRIIRSIAPSIHGHADVKTALALALFGGRAKNVQGKHALRGDINVLLLGDPGTAKSQFLKYVEKTAPRAIYTTGQGASAVGLTAAVRRDPITREWTLEGGALVLADKGVCLIDEFDKMNDVDRTSLHEAMEQQSISISKAGIVTTLQARCSIIAAANPLRGRYNSALPLSQNVQLTEPILSRFDILCVVRDVVDPVADEQLARFVVGSHLRSHPHVLMNTMEEDSHALADRLQAGTTPLQGSIEPIPQSLLRKYILYAKAKVRPELSQLDVDKIARLYADLRRESLATGSVPITVRHIESMVRMAEAHARMHLRDHVRADDIELAIRVMLESFIQAQKYSVMTHLRRAFGKYISHRKEHGELLLFALQELFADKVRYLLARQGLGGAHTEEESNTMRLVELDFADFEARARELGIYDVKPFLTSRTFVASGYRYDGSGQLIVKEMAI